MPQPQPELWRDYAAELHRVWKETEDATLSGPDGLATTTYLSAVRNYGFKGHSGQWFRVVQNAGQESAGSRVPKKLLQKG